jgi:type I restriction enzyme S subunit
MYGTIAKTALTGVELATNQAIAIGVPKRALVGQEFLYYAVSQLAPALDALARGATQRNINRSHLEDSVIRVPSLK